MIDANPIILGIETATLAGSVSVARGDSVLASRLGDARESHSNTLLRDISDVLSEAQIVLTDVEVFAAAVGPGSFTGLRIGLATTKALAATMKRRCVAVPTLKAIAKAVGPLRNTVALLPAGRGEVFAQLFSLNDQGHLIELDAPAHLPPQKLLARYAGLQEVVWAGPATEIHRNLIESYALENSRGWTIASFEPNLAKHVIALAVGSYRRGVTVPPESLQALYVRPLDAELKANVVNR